MARFSISWQKPVIHYGETVIEASSEEEARELFRRYSVYGNSIGLRLVSDQDSPGTSKHSREVLDVTEVE